MSLVAQAPRMPWFLKFLEGILLADPQLVDVLIGALISSGKLSPEQAQVLQTVAKLEAVYAQHKPGNVTFAPDDGSAVVVISHFAP